MVSAIACIYAACMVGHQFKSHPALAGIPSFFGMQYVQGWIEKLLGCWGPESMRRPSIPSWVMRQHPDYPLCSGLHGPRGPHAGHRGGFRVFWFGLTVWLMRNRLNME